MGMCRQVAQCAYTGDDVNGKEENRIAFLKGCQLLKEIGGYPISKDLILSCISTIGDRVVERLRHLPEATMIKSYDVTRLDQYGGGWKIACDSQELSLPDVGKQVASWT